MAKSSQSNDTKPSQTPKRLRILVLETDQTLPSTNARKGSFGEIFHSLFTKAGQAHSPPLEIDTVMRFVVESEEGGKVPDPEIVREEGVDAVLLSGSTYDAHGGEEWILKLVGWIRDVWKANPSVKFSGVCFGHQILCRALGSTVSPSPGNRWELSHTKINLSPLGESLFRVKDNIFLHEMHVDHVVDVPSYESSGGLIGRDAKVEVWGSSEMTKIQGVWIEGRLFTSQGHLGYDEVMVKRHVDVRVEKGLLDDERKAEEAKERAGLDHDGLTVAAAILRFFYGDGGNFDFHC